MKILYGVQATGNGHITRARALVPWLRRLGFEVDVLLSGRPRDQLFGLEVFGHYRTRKGFTFALADGRVRPMHTLFHADLKTFWRDVQDLNVEDYDVILTDFEPVTAWAAKLKGRECIGIGHQYAFQHPVPKAGFNYLARTILCWFAPASTALGLHWDSFNSPVLPPIIETDQAYRAPMVGQYLVYLPFDSHERVMNLLRAFPGVAFTYYAGVDAPYQERHIQVKPYSRAGFKDDLARAEGVVCGAGFELPSEALHLGKKLLVQPLQGQFEQCSNARALELLERAQVMRDLNPEALRRFFNASPVAPVHYPDVARAIAEWLKGGRTQSVQALADQLWAQTRAEHRQVSPHFARHLSPG
ncbi:glycosyltransferase [Simiduia sp. 21SJ11W-1]|uniref:MJ1255/VC2487 family glycosyltransferase n=1 Tax=Simiduia sp. 21SJ11W-1 TaxID=2909669 RepID=UPI00209F934E|nr:MJ1255/VC2487 family glycosyltransferase [Simiduia sp. 21SJ11W-1]UTA48473.1 glycosyltransferase [Simiduia sp. 21SJ11W-1]